MNFIGIFPLCVCVTERNRKAVPFPSETSAEQQWVCYLSKLHREILTCTFPFWIKGIMGIDEDYPERLVIIRVRLGQGSVSLSLPFEELSSLSLREFPMRVRISKDV